VLRHAEAILRGSPARRTDLAEDDGAAAERLRPRRELAREVGEWEPRARGWARELEELRIRLDDVALQVGRRAGEVEADPARLDAVEERLALLERSSAKPRRRQLGGAARAPRASRRRSPSSTPTRRGARRSRRRCATALAAYRAPPASSPRRATAGAPRSPRRSPRSWRPRAAQGAARR
jgi:hypothetical protein